MPRAMKFMVLLLTINLKLYITTALPSVIKLGGIFEKNDLMHRAAFEFAVRKLNDRDSQTEWVAEVTPMQSADSLTAYNTTCFLLGRGISAMFGPSTEPAMSQTQSLCDLKEMPHVLSVMERQLMLPKSYSAYSISLFPQPYDLGLAIADAIRYYQWNSVLVLYEHDGNLLDLQAVLELTTTGAETVDVRVRKMPDYGGYGPLLKEVKDTMKEYKMVVHARLQTIQLFMRQAAEFNMLASQYHYFFTNLDVYTLDLKLNDKTAANMTGLKLIQYDRKKLTELTDELQSDQQVRPESDQTLFLPTANVPDLMTFGMQTSFAVMWDSVNLIARAIKKSDLSGLPLSCTRNEGWDDGSSLMNQIKLTEYDGVTGHIMLDDSGQRSNYQLEIIDFHQLHGFQTLGTWTPNDGLNITKDSEISVIEATETLENKTLRITVILEEPFVMLKQSEESLKGNDQFEGFCVDLLDEIAKLRKFNYTIHVVKDRSYGSRDVDGNWNGMVGELMRGEADVAASSLTISYSRSEVIDFTVPYMHLGISILFKKPKRKDPGLFTFLSPLSLDVWLYMLIAYVGVSMMLWIMARFSPYEWSNPQRVDDDTDELENQFSLGNSFWFTVGSLMQQGSDLTPRAPSTRLAACMWWLFTLILISSYTANLAAFLTVERMVSPIESADDLAKQIRIKYGTLGRGSTMSFFKESRIETYSRMWAFMESQIPSVFVNSSKEGIARVKAGDYAYLMESAMLEYFVERDCDLMQIGGLLDSKGYGIGLPKHSKYREPISSAILLLQEKTVLAVMKEKWWKRMRGGGKCSGEASKKSASHNELGLQNVGGVFVVLAFGMCFAFCTAICEFLHRSRRRSAEERRPLCTEMCQELHFAMTCHADTKPVRSKQSISTSTYAKAGCPDDTYGTRVNMTDSAVPMGANEYPISSPYANPRSYSPLPPLPPLSRQIHA